MHAPPCYERTIDQNAYVEARILENSGEFTRIMGQFEPCATIRQAISTHMSSVDAQLKYLRGSAKEIAGVRLTIEIVAAEQRT